MVSAFKQRFMILAAPTNLFVAALEQLGPRDHLCSIHEHQQEQSMVVIHSYESRSSVLEQAH